MASSLLGLLQDGAHCRDDGGLGAGGSGRHRDDGGQRRCGGDDGGLGQGHRDRRVPFAFPLLSVCWEERDRGEAKSGDYRGMWGGGVVTPVACSPVAVVVLVLLAVEAAVLEGLVPFLVPVTNSICATKARMHWSW